MEIHELKLHNFSYSRVDADEQCRRKRYLGREWGGTGLQLVRAGWALVFGNILHKALEDFAQSCLHTGCTVDYEALRKHTYTEALAGGFDVIAARDWSVLAEGLIRGFTISVWPGLMAEYAILDTERWIEWEVEPGFLFRARQDLLLQNKFDGHIAMVDYKSTSSTKPQWIASWAKSVQMHSSMYAMKQSQGIDVNRCFVIGLSKGYTDKDKQQRSPFSYGYVNREYPMSPNYKVEYQRTRGWELMSTAAEFESLEEWMELIPPTLLSEQFPMTGPIMPRNDIAETWFRQQMLREHEVEEGNHVLHTSTSVEEITPVLDRYYRQNFSHCQPAYGYECEFKELCWIPTIEADPVGSGLFKRYDSQVTPSEAT